MTTTPDRRASARFNSPCACAAYVEGLGERSAWLVNVSRQGAGFVLHATLPLGSHLFLRRPGRVSRLLYLMVVRREPWGDDFRYGTSLSDPLSRSQLASWVN